MRILFSILTCALLACCAIQSPQAGPVGFRLSSGFKPSQIPGLQLWLDASQITGLNDGDAVATWSDVSGNARDFTQGTASSRPTYKTNQRGSLPAVLFDGIDDYLSATFSCTGKTVVCVFKITGGVQYDRPFNFSPDYKCLYRDTTNTRVGSYNGVFGPLLAGVSTGFLTAIWTFDGSGSNLRVDGVDATPVAGSFGTAFNGSHSVSAPSFEHTGYVAHLLVYDTVISAGDIASLETYFGTH